MATMTQPKLDKGTMILGIVQLFDTCEALTYELNAMQREKANSRSSIFTPQPDEKELPPYHHIDTMMLTVGQKKVYEDSLYSWEKVTASKDDETGVVKVTPFDKWVKNKVRDIPDYMSFDEFCIYFDSELHISYEREKEEAIAKLAVKDEDDD